MGSIRVGVVRGGPSSEYEVSLKTGGEVLRHLPENYTSQDIFIDREGSWHLSGFPSKPLKIFEAVDVLFNGLHGEFGEDGKIQQIFDSYNVRYTGSGVFASAMAMKKHLAREVFKKAGLRIPKANVFRADEFFGFYEPEYYAEKTIKSMPPPWVVKPSSAGSSVGVSICRSFSELVDGVKKAIAVGSVFLVEEYIKGREATCGILENFKGEHYYALPVIEIIPPQGNFFDYDVKYDGSTNELCPAGFSNATKREIENMARTAHQALSCRHYSRTDFIVSDKSMPAGRQGIYVLETNTLPGLTSQSLFPKAAQAAGLEFPQLLDHLIRLALNK